MHFIQCLHVVYSSSPPPICSFAATHDNTTFTQCSRNSPPLLLSPRPPWNSLLTMLAQCYPASRAWGHLSTNRTSPSWSHLCCCEKQARRTLRWKPTKTCLREDSGQFYGLGCEAAFGITLTTTVSQWGPRLAFAIHEAVVCAAFASLDCFVVLALCDGDRHASITISMLGLAYLRRRVVFNLCCCVARGSSLPFQPAEHLLWRSGGEYEMFWKFVGLGRGANITE